MKNKSIKYILISIALTSSLLFTACGKKSEPVNETPETAQTEETTTSEEAEQDVSVYMDEDGISEFNSKQGKVEGHTVNLEDTTTTESNTNVDSTGVDVQLSEDEYQGTRPEDETTNSEAVEDVADSAVEITKDRALKDAQDWLDQGLITQEEYDDMLDMIQEHFEPKPTQSTQTPGYSQQQLTPEQQAAADAMITTGKGDQRTDIQYGNAEVPDDLKGKFIGN